MAFHFVNATPDDIEYSAETRRRIRSQAMRDYRRRQRDEDNELESSPELSPPSAIASPELSSQSQSREDSRPRQSSSHSLSVQPGILRRHSSGTSSDNPPSRGVGTSTGKRRSPQSPLENEESQSVQRQRRRTSDPRAQHGVFGQFMIDLPKHATPPTIAEDIEALTSPGRLEQMLDICNEYNSWLSSTVAENTETGQDKKSYDDKTSQMLLCALCLKSIGHLEVVRSSECSLEKSVLKTRVLALLNKRLKNPSKALEDDTIGALACLASYEMSQGSAEATMHLSGLQQIIKLRGGTRKIGNTAGLGMFLEILDLTHAVYFHTSPMFTSADRSQPSPHEETPGPPSRSGTRRGELDQAMLDDISNFILSIPELAETGEELPRGQQALRTVTRTTFEDQVDDWARSLNEASQHFGESNDSTLWRVCHLAAEVHLLTTSAVQAHPMRIRSKTEELFKVMEVAANWAWDAHSAVHTRVLLTALSTAPPDDLKQKSFYHAHLTRRLYQTQAEDWANVKALVIGFVEMQTTARQPREPRAVTALAGDVDVEIVVGAREVKYEERMRRAREY